MRYLLILLTLTSIIYSNESYFRSNNSGIPLEEIDGSDIDQFEYYIVEEDRGNEIVKTLINEGQVQWRETLFLNEGSDYPSKREKVEGSKREVEEYNNGWETSLFSLYENGSLQYKDRYSYDSNSLLKDVTREDGSGEILYKDLFHRGQSGELRQVVRSIEGSFTNRWFYQEGVIIESWYIDDISSIRTIYSDLGDIKSVINYDDKDIIYSEEYTYDENRVLQLVIKTTEDSTEERFYNEEGLVSELKIKESDILVKKHLYRYSGDTLISEKITGHGRIEEYIYTLDSEGDVILISYYVDKELKSNIIKESEDKEIKEFFKDGTLFLREYFKDKEKIERELYIDGVLYKREKYSE